MKLDSDHWMRLELDSSTEEPSTVPPFWPGASRSPSPTATNTTSSSANNNIAPQNGNSKKQVIAATYSSPASLQNLSLETFNNQLRNLCQSKNYVNNKRGLKHYLKFLLPVPLRQQLLDLSTKDGRIYTLVDLNMFELLLSPAVTQVDIQSVRPFFRQPFAAMLRQLGNGLEELVLEDNCWVQGRELLPPALARMTGLCRVSLRFIATDFMIAALAKNCLHLQELDVSNSNSVTDAGMKVLCQPDSPLFEEAAGPESPPPPTATGTRQRLRKISAPVLASSAGCMLWLRRGRFRRHSVIHENKKPHPDFTRSNSEEEEENLLYNNEESLPNNNNNNSQLKCIRSLRRLDVHSTKVSPVGIQLILASSPTISILT